MATERVQELTFSALGRAVWDETGAMRMVVAFGVTFSALGRAVWDETEIAKADADVDHTFQCSRSSRMG